MLLVGILEMLLLRHLKMEVGHQMKEASMALEKPILPISKWEESRTLIIIIIKEYPEECKSTIINTIEDQLEVALLHTKAPGLQSWEASQLLGLESSKGKIMKPYLKVLAQCSRTL